MTKKIITDVDDPNNSEVSRKGEVKGLKVDGFKPRELKPLDDGDIREDEKTDPVSIDDIRLLAQMRKELEQQRVKIKDWVFARIPRELMSVPNVSILTGPLLGIGATSFFIGKEMFEYLGGEASARGYLEQLKTQLAPIVEVEIRESIAIGGGIDVSLELAKP